MIRRPYGTYGTHSELVPDAEELPTLRLHTSAHKWPKSYRRKAAAAGIASVLPASVAVWAIVALGLEGIGIAMLGGLFAFAFLASAVLFFLTKHHLTLSGREVENRTKLKTTHLAAADVTGFVTLRKGDRIAHIALGTHGIVGLGPGLSDQEHEQVKAWIKMFSASRGVPYHGEVDQRGLSHLLQEWHK